MSIYVETFIRAPIDEVWRLTQTPDLHKRWDLRFSDIKYSAALRRIAGRIAAAAFPLCHAHRLWLSDSGAKARQFGSRETAGSGRTSVLKFWSDDAKSLIRAGSGYWKYQP